MADVVVLAPAAIAWPRRPPTCCSSARCWSCLAVMLIRAERAPGPAGRRPPGAGARRPAHRPGEPPRLRRGARVDADPAASAPARRSCSSTSTRSRRSTTRTATRSATPSSCTWPRVLREQIRADDAVVSRLGGDELAVLLPRLHAGRRRAAGRGPAARRPARLPLPLADGTLLALSISLGVAHVPERQRRPDRALPRRGRRAVRGEAGRPRPRRGRRSGLRTTLRRARGGVLGAGRQRSGSLIRHSSGWRNGRRASLRC